MFKKLCIIGMGMMGGSLARAVRQHGLADVIAASDRNMDHLKSALEIGLVDEIFEDPAEAVKGADLVILSTPVRSFPDIAEHIAPALEDDVIVSDLGSVKGYVVDSLSAFIDGSKLIPGHPIAGSEKAGPQNFVEGLFENRWCVLTPLENSNLTSIDRLRTFWQNLGSKVEIMTPEQHDRVLAVTSHIPHLVSYSMTHTANHLENVMETDVIRFSAGGFRDFTRLAGSDPVMWRDVFLTNKDAVIEILDYLRQDLDNLQALIEADDGKELKEIFTETREIRQQVVQAKQHKDA